MSKIPARFRPTLSEFVRRTVAKLGLPPEGRAAAMQGTECYFALRNAGGLLRAAVEYYTPEGHDSDDFSSSAAVYLRPRGGSDRRVIEVSAANIDALFDAIDA